MYKIDISEELMKFRYFYFRIMAFSTSENKKFID